MYVRMYVCTYVRTYVRTVRMYVRMYVCTYVRTYVRTTLWKKKVGFRFALFMRLLIFHWAAESG